MAQQYIFGDKYFKQWLDSFKLEEVPGLESKTKIISNYIKAIESGRVEKTKEESIQADFLNNFFGEVLGYEYKAADKWNLEKEYKSQTDATKSDGALGFFSTNGNEIKADVRAVIELKDALTDLDKPQLRLNDKRTPVEQAFSYASKAGGNCKWVIVSNFLEIRLYHASDQGTYEKFTVSELTEPEKLKRFFYVLSKNNLISETKESVIEKLFRERQELEQSISKKFYSEYKALRMELFAHLKINNQGLDELLLFNKTQKLLDRFIFVCFCEDAGLVPPYILKTTKDILQNALDLEPNKLWRQLKGLFHSIDLGNPPMDINKFNGGLFAKDDELDNLTILDDILLKLINFSEYDFESDINVNILGHIFEQSLSDIEEIKTQIGNGKELLQDERSEVKKNGKRKKEGIFYTPEYITSYIVKEAVGGWLEDRRKELGFYELPELTEEDYKSIKHEKKKNKQTGKYSEILTCNDNIHTHIVYWETYREKLRNIRILDPACGSGAFLNQVFDFLYKEGQEVNAQLRVLQLGQYEMFDLDKHILTNNIFGVDLNSESVEITKLSLWLKTANKSKELTTLDQNIKCGNSLIDDIGIAGEKAFNWFAEFPQVFPNYRDKEKADRDKNRAKIISTGVLDYPDLGDEEYADETDEPLFSYKPGSKGFEKYGFDVIVGNPPYGTSFNENEKDYLSKFDELVPDYEIYIYFISKATRLLKANGIMSYIFPNTFLAILYGKQYRQRIIDNNSILSITDLSDDPTFVDASVRTCVFCIKKEITNNSVSRINKIDILSKNIIVLNEVSYELLVRNIDNWFKLFGYSPEKDNLLQKVKSIGNLNSICEVSQGYIPYRRSDLIREFGDYGNQIVDNRLWHSENKKDDEYIQEILGKDLFRYFNTETRIFIKYGKHVASYVDFKFFNGPRILVREIVEDRLICTYVEKTYCNNPSIINVILRNNEFSLFYILAILNSKLIGWYHYNTSPKAKKGLFPKILVNDVRNIPVPNISVELQLNFISYTEIMLSKNKELFEIKTQFIKVLQSRFPTIKLTSKIDSWYSLSFADFSKELVKQKIKLSLNEQTEWLTHFEENKTKAEVIKNIVLIPIMELSFF